LRLVHAGEPIASFDVKKLSGKPDCFVIKADTNENRRKRDELCARVEADIFIPAGGRPYTVNDRNWQTFLGPNELPTMRAIVEGANIFFTPEARKNLQEKGVLIIKDSSANKAGVICSSFEIIASLILSEKEFLDIKDEYVKEVLDILRAKADSEAKLLFREYEKHGGQKTLVQLSMEISREINDVTDILLEDFTQRADVILESPIYQGLVFRHCPNVLVKMYSDRITNGLPKPHKVAILAAYIASYVVYREGLGWLDSIPKNERILAAQTYMEKDQMTYELIEAVEKSGITDKEQIAKILRMSAARNLTMMSMRDRIQK
jgi:glutamate dehydrogenase